MGKEPCRIGRCHYVGVSLLALYVLLVMGANAQVQWSGQASAAFIQSNSGQSQNVYNDGRGTFAWRLDLFGDAILTDQLTFHGTARMLQDQVFHIDRFSLEATDITPLNWTIDAGEIEIPMGDLGSRRYPMGNPFLGLPISNEHYTTIRSSDLVLWPLDTRYTAGRNGVLILDQGLYDLGIRLSGTAGIFDYSAALINGTVSQTSTYSGQGLSPNGQLGKIVRLAATPVIGLTLGASYARGIINSVPSLYAYQYSTASQSFAEHVLEGDLTFGLGHLTVYGQLVSSVWELEYRYGDNLTAFGYSLEGEYTVAPRLSFAARAGGLVFNSIEDRVVNPDYTLAYYEGRWDMNAVRLEGAMRYRLSREATAKAVFQWTRTTGQQPDPIDRLVAVQAVFSF